MHVALFEFEFPHQHLLYNLKESKLSFFDFNYAKNYKTDMEHLAIVIRRLKYVSKMFYNVNEAEIIIEKHSIINNNIIQIFMNVNLKKLS